MGRTAHEVLNEKVEKGEEKYRQQVIYQAGDLDITRAAVGPQSAQPRKFEIVKMSGSTGSLGFRNKYISASFSSRQSNLPVQ